MLMGLGFEEDFFIFIFLDFDYDRGIDSWSLLLLRELEETFFFKILESFDSLVSLGDQAS